MLLVVNRFLVVVGLALGGLWNGSQSAALPNEALVVATRSEGQASGNNRQQAPLDLNAVREAPALIRPVDASASVADLKVVRTWDGSICRSQLINNSRSPVAIKEVVLWTIPLSLPRTTGFYGEVAQMLSQTGGTLARPCDPGPFPHCVHHRLPPPVQTT